MIVLAGVCEYCHCLDVKEEEEGSPAHRADYKPSYGPRGKKRDKTHINTFKGTEMVCICLSVKLKTSVFNLRRRDTWKSMQMLMFLITTTTTVMSTVTAPSILSQSFPPVGRPCAIAKQLVISDEDWATSHIHKNTHTRRQQEMTGKVFL